MKKYSKHVALLFLLSSLMSCRIHPITTTPSGKIPPGQAKKITGSKSARYYAPGHNK